MKYYIKQIDEKVNHIETEKNRVLVWRNQDVLKLFPIDRLLYSGPIINIFSSVHGILIECDDKGNRIWVTEEGLEEFNHGVSSIIKIQTNFHLLQSSYNEDYSIKEISLLNTKSGTRKWEIQVGVIDKIKCIENYFIVCNKRGIRLFQISDGVLLWENELSEKSIRIGELDSMPAVSKIIGFDGHNLYLCFDTGVVASFDMGNGGINNTWCDIPALPNPYGEGHIEKMLYVNSMVFDDEYDRLVGMSGTVLWTIDLKTKIINSFNLWNDLESSGLESIKRVTNISNSETHYYTTAETAYNVESDRRYDAVVAINKKTLKIDWAHIFDVAWLATHTPQYVMGTIYQLDNDCNLYTLNQENLKM